MTQHILTLLNSYTKPTLEDMTEAAGFDIAPNNKKRKKVDLVEYMRRNYFTPQRIRASYAKLSQLEKNILNRLRHTDKQRTRTSHFKRILIRHQIATPSKTPRYQGTVSQPNSTVFEDIIARLTLHGLIFSENTQAHSGKLSFSPSQYLFTPPLVHLHLPKSYPIAPNKITLSPTNIQQTSPHSLLRDLYLYWNYVRHNPITLLKTHLVGKRDLKQINPLLLQPDEALATAKREDHMPRLFFLRQLLTALQLCKQTHQSLTSISNKLTHIPKFWQKSLSQQLALVLAKILKNKTASFIKHTHQYTGNTTGATQKLLNLVKKLAPDEWVSYDDLYMLVSENSREFLFTNRRSIEQNNYGSFNGQIGNTYIYYKNRVELLNELDESENIFIHAFIEQFLLGLGIVEIGLVGENEKVFRPTPLGYAALHNRAFAPEQDPGRVIIQPNFQILAIGPVSFATLATLDIFAKRTRIDTTVFEYQLTHSTVYKAQQAEFDTSTIQQWLTELSNKELPQNVQRSLEEWGASHERITFRRGITLLQTASPALLQELQASPVKSHLARFLTPTVAYAKSKRTKNLVTALLAAGLPPAVAGADPATADNSVIIEADGSVQPVHAVPTLYLAGRLEKVAQEQKGGKWQITAQSIKKAGPGRANVTQTLAELTKLHRGRLPKALTEQIKVWGNYYGQATTQTVTLVEFSDPQSLADLLTRPDISPLLTPFPAGDRALATIQQTNLPQLQTLLTQLGIPLAVSC